MASGLLIFCSILIFPQYAVRVSLLIATPLVEPNILLLSKFCYGQTRRRDCRLERDVSKNIESATN